jgi:protoheme IX farnesyltransferase
MERRFARLALVTAAVTYVLVVIGALVRSTGSGMGCPDWPLCHGALIPPLGNTEAWIEYVHRWVAVIVGLLVLAMAVLAVWRPTLRSQRALLWPTLGAVVLVGLQAWFGRITVVTGNAGEWVTLHLATALLLLAVLTFVAVRARYSIVPSAGGGASQRLTLVVAFAAASVYALMLFGAHVTATGASLIFPDWPLFDGSFVPAWSSNPATAALQLSHFLHRFVALVVALIVIGTAWATWSAARAKAPGGQALLGLVGSAAALYAVQVIVGALQISTQLAWWAVAAHLALGAAIWVLLAAAVFIAWFEARSAGADIAGRLGVDQPGAPSSVRDRLRAYMALTKPRIIELLLVTTLPAMVLAAHGLPPLGLVVATLVGGTLAAGAANAINCYLDRDIDLLMVRTRRRPLPAHNVEPENALVFGLALGVVAFAIMAVFTNLVAAFLTLIAMAFYVGVYTLLLKRTTPQNIVLGGAAGALPPVIGWAAVTGDITLPALLLFAIVFYWTPPHFWALSLRLRGDYAAARVPMLPVVHGVPETTRQIALYSILMVALTLIFFAVARMGLLFLAGALVLGALFLAQAFSMWREGTDQRAVRLYRYSITYLTGLFALIVLDVFLFLPA